MNFIRKIEVANNLERVIDRYVRKSGVIVERPCRGLLDRMIEQGLQRISLDKAGDSPGRLRTAEDNLEDFLKSMDEQSKNLGHYPYLSEREFWHAKVKSGSHWPFA